MRLRWSLPLVHALADALLLFSLARMVGGARQDYRPMTEMESILWREAPTPEPLSAIALGTPPAGLAATLVIPNWRRSTPFDYRWAAIHVSLAMIYWGAVGRIGEGARAGLRRLLLGYAGVRLALIPVSLTLEPTFWSSVGTVALVAAWFAAGLLVVAGAMKAIIRKVSG